MNSEGKFHDGKKVGFFIVELGSNRLSKVYLSQITQALYFKLLSKIAVQHIIVLCLIGQACCQLGHTIINKPDSRKDARFLPAAPTTEAIKYT